MSWMFKLFDDELTVGFCSIDVGGLARGDPSHRVRFDRQWPDGEENDRDFIIAAALLQQGERVQRKIVRRKLKRGTRNISNKIPHCLSLLAWALEPELMNTDNRKEKNKVFGELEGVLEEVLRRAAERAGVSGELLSPLSYLVTDDVMAAAVEGGCDEYFNDIKGQRFLEADRGEIESAIRKEFPHAADSVIAAFRKTKNLDHLSMISLEPSKEGGRFVTVVDPKGHHLKVEAGRFIEMINGNGESRRLFVFPKHGGREAIESSFNDRKEGEVIGKISMAPTKLEVACCVGNGLQRNVVDQARFYLDPKYLLALSVVLERTASDERRYRELKAKAEMFTDYDPFAPGVS